MITKNSYAKINLYLDVLDKRFDGYHNIKSVMQSISLFDTLSLEITDVSGENEIEILCNCSNLKCDNSNLIYKAFIRFFEKTQIKGKKCTFSLEKIYQFLLVWLVVARMHPLLFCCLMRLVAILWIKTDYLILLVKLVQMLPFVYMVERACARELVKKSLRLIHLRMHM